LTLLWVASLLLFAALLGGQFLTVATLQSVAFQLPELGFLTLAMAVVILSGGINLSTVATANLSALLVAHLVTTIDLGNHDLPVFGLIGVGLVLATVAGAVNGLVIAYGRLPPILATLGTMTLFNGLAVALTRGAAISGFPSTLVALGNGTILGFPVPMVLFLLGCLVVHIVLRRTSFGWTIRMIGSNIRATEFSGIPTQRVLVGLYALSGALSGMAGLIMMARFNSAKANYGDSYLLVSILAAILGGLNPDGGFGGLPGVLVALLILQTAASGFNLLGLDPFLTIVAWGVILLAILAFSRRQGK
jgi:ribose/xylose/arabinose/galactoside ABC-type transport system permease subunit